MNQLDQIYKSVLPAINAVGDIYARNEAFDSLSDKVQKKEIALDALNLLLNDVTEPSNIGVYWGVDLQTIKAETPKEFQEKLLTLESLETPIKCIVCARGSIMLSLIRLGNNIGSSNPHRSDGHVEVLKGFDSKEMYDMEEEYETSYFNMPYLHNTTDKLANILINVLVNGTFNTEDKTDYVEKYEILS